MRVYDVVGNCGLFREAIKHHLGPLKLAYSFVPIVTGYIAKAGWALGLCVISGVLGSMIGCPGCHHYPGPGRLGPHRHRDRSRREGLGSADLERRQRRADHGSPGDRSGETRGLVYRVYRVKHQLSIRVFCAWSLDSAGPEATRCRSSPSRRLRSYRLSAPRWCTQRPCCRPGALVSR